MCSIQILILVYLVVEFFKSECFLHSRFPWSETLKNIITSYFVFSVWFTCMCLDCVWLYSGTPVSSTRESNPELSCLKKKNLVSRMKPNDWFWTQISLTVKQAELDIWTVSYFLSPELNSHLKSFYVHVTRPHRVSVPFVSKPLRLRDWAPSSGHVLKCLLQTLIGQRVFSSGIFGLCCRFLWTVTELFWFTSPGIFELSSFPNFTGYTWILVNGGF